MIVDMHAHVFTRKALAEVDENIKRYVPQLPVEAGNYSIVTGERHTALIELMPGVDNLKDRLKVMNDAGVDVKVVSVTTGNFCTRAKIIS